MKYRTANAIYLISHVAMGLSVFTLVFFAVSSIVVNDNRLSLLPAPGLNPQQVIRIQLYALRNNTPDDEGIAVAFRFTSPENRQKTGPLLRFTSLLRSTTYQPLLNHLSVTYGKTASEADRSYTPVIVTDRYGVSTAFMWVLARQTDGTCDGCWMTESVLWYGDLHHLQFA